MREKKNNFFSCMANAILANTQVTQVTTQFFANNIKVQYSLM